MRLGNCSLTGGSKPAYDGAGNPNYWFKVTRSGNAQTITRGYELTWERGRNLTEVKDGGISSTYEYNDSGIRVKKAVGGVTHRYYLNGMTILAEDRVSGTGTDRLYYYYDADGVAGIHYNGTDYYYRKNLQGDITHILDGTGEVVASYRYDA